jgi:hypothetical protein
VIPAGATPWSSVESPQLHREAPTTCVSHALGLVKSFWPKARLEVLAQGVAADCSEEL